MTLEEICVLTLRQLNEDEDALDELRSQLYADINEGLNDLYAIYPSWQKKVVPDAGGCFSIPEIVSGTARLVKLCVVGGAQLFWQEDSGNVMILREGFWDADKSLAGTDIIATLRSLPAILSTSSDVPDVPVQFHRALADYACFRMLGLGTVARQNRAAHFYERFLRAKSMLSAWVNKNDRLANKF